VNYPQQQMEQQKMLSGAAPAFGASNTAFLLALGPAFGV
jgi:hypothetical protein